MKSKLKNIVKLAWRNIWRNRRRTFFTLLALTVGVMCLVLAKSFLAGIIQNASEAVVKTQSGHIRMVRQEYLRLERIMPKEQLVTGISAIQKALLGDASLGITAMQQRINFNVLCSAGGYNEAGLAMGIEPEAADKTMRLSRSIVAGRYLDTTASEAQLLIGKTLAKQLHVEVGSELLLVTTDINYSTFALPFRVVGIFKTGFSMQDNHVLYIPLAKAQQMLDCRDAAHELLLFIKNPGDASVVAQRMEQILRAPTLPVQGEIAVVPWQHNDVLRTMLPLMEDIYGKILAIIMFIVALVILNTMLMAVMERYHEIGVMKAMGFKNSEVFGMIIVEAFYIGVMGSLAGGILGGVIGAVLEKTGIDMARMGGESIWAKVDLPVPLLGTVLYPDVTYAILSGAVGFGIIVALLAVVYPAFKSASMLPVEAFRSQLKV